LQAGRQELKSENEGRKNRARGKKKVFSGPSPKTTQNPKKQPCSGGGNIGRVVRWTH